MEGWLGEAEGLSIWSDGLNLLVRGSGFSCLSDCCPVLAAKRPRHGPGKGRRICRAPRVWKFPLLFVFFVTLFPAHLLSIVLFLYPFADGRGYWGACGAVCLLWKEVGGRIVLVGRLLLIPRRALRLEYS